MTLPSSTRQRNTVFISHAHADNQLCDQYVTALRARGYDIWYDRSNMENGGSISGQIEHELATRSAFVLFLTPAAINSYWVRLEIDAYRDLAAKDRSRLFLPVVVVPCEIPPLLRGLKWIDATHLSPPAAVEAIDHALRAVPEALPTKVSRSHPAWRWGPGLGILTGLSEAGAAILFTLAPANQGTPVVVFFVLLGAVISFLAALFAARENGQLRSGIAAGIISQLVGILVFAALIPALDPRYQTMYDQDHVVASIETLLILALVAGIGGALIGLFGGLTGRSGYRRHLRGA